MALVSDRSKYLFPLELFVDGLEGVKLCKSDTAARRGRAAR